MAPRERQAWLDVGKGAAMLSIMAVHAVERSLGPAYWANPAADWPSLATRLRQWTPATGGAWELVGNPVRWIGWLGDLAPAVFVLATGYLLARAPAGPDAGGPAPEGYLRQVSRRLARFLPMFWIVFVASAAVAMVTGRDAPSPADGAFWLSLVGFRATSGTIYYGAGAWWYVGFLVQLAFLAPLLVRFLAPGPRARARAWWLLGGAVTAKAVLLVALADSGQLDPTNRGGVIVGRLPELAAGLLLGVIVRGAPDPQALLRRELRLPTAVAGLAVGFLAAFTLAGNACAGVLVGLGAVGVCVHAVDAGTHLAARGLTFVSRHSLAIFLAHPVANQLTPQGPVPLDAVVAVRIGAALVLGVAAGIALERAYALAGRVARAVRPGGVTAPAAGT